jgi:alkyl hydroperoxide reductase subunit AhpC
MGLKRLSDSHIILLSEHCVGSIGLLISYSLDFNFQCTIHIRIPVIIKSGFFTASLQAVSV